MYFKGDIIITDRMCVVKSEEDWHRCAYGENLEALGIVHYITSGNGDCFYSDVFSLDAQSASVSIVCITSLFIIRFSRFIEWNHPSWL